MPDHRVEIKFEHRFSRKSDNGKAFGWLKDNYGSDCDDAIINLVRFVYLPFFLAESGAELSEIETKVRKAKEYVDEKMMKALGSWEQKEKSSATSNGTAPVTSKNVSSFRSASAGRDKPNTSNDSNSTSTPTIADDDDFLELDEDKLMEG